MKRQTFQQKNKLQKEPHGNFIAKCTSEVKNHCMGNKIEMTANRIKDKLINVQF